MVRPHKGKPQNDWEEQKTEKINVSLTPTGKRLAKIRAEQIGLSISEVIERWARSIPVDRDDAIVTSTEEIPSVKSVIDALPCYSRQQLAQFIWTALSLLIGNPSTKEEKNKSEKKRIADFVREHRTACVEMFTDAIDNPEERIDAIIAGGEPTLMELSLLSGCLPINDDELMRIYKKEFPNGNAHQGSLQSC